MRKNFLLLFSSFLGLFLVLELGFRLMGYHGMSLGFEPVGYSEKLGWVLKENFEETWTALEWSVPYKTNSRGFRDQEHALKKDSETIRIVVLGDSFAEGWGVRIEEMWQTLIKNSLTPQTEIINLGVRGYDILQEYRQFLLFGVQYEPDVVIQILCDNDYALGTENETMIMGEVRRFRPQYKIHSHAIEFSPNPGKEEHPFIPAEACLRFIKKIIYGFASVAWLRERLLLIPRSAYYLEKIGLRKKQNEKFFTSDPYDRDYTRAVEIIYDHFSKLKTEKKFKMIVVWVGRVPMPPALSELIKAKIGEPLSISLPAWARWKYDGHPNKKGNEIIASEILKYSHLLQHTL